MTPPPSRLAGAAARTQHRVATALGIDEGGRAQTVVSMLANNARRAPGYWVQLVLAAGIATLGLVLDSTAVVIGGMLVSPLMGPIVELGMGFAVGSSLLVLRASIRVLTSVVAVVAAAAVLTLWLPFHEVTSQISTRAAPTALDLFVAMFCALTAAYTTVRPGADSTAAAAGTAIGIALVPPLCAAGFGIGTGAPTIAGGAALLFTANLSAILLLSALSFLLLGYNQVDAETLEREFLDGESSRVDRVAEALQGRLRSVAGSRYAIALRLAVPLLFLGAVYVPLRRALDEVTWEVKSREAVRRLVRDESPAAVQTQLTVERRTLTLRLLIVGTTAKAIALEDTLSARITRATKVVPSVTVIAVPNARSLAAQTNAATHTSEATPPPTPSLAELRHEAGTALAGTWPASAGRVAGWELMLGAGDTAQLTIRHIGRPVDSMSAEILGRALESRLHVPVRVGAIALPATQLTAAAGQEKAWLDSARLILAQVAQTDSASTCVQGPTQDRRRIRAAARRAVDSVRASPSAAAGRLTVTDGAILSLRIAAGSCMPPASPASPAPPPPTVGSPPANTATPP
jgi:uncharacterized hydrophobic protein (TIGR00271 family)